MKKKNNKFLASALLLGGAVLLVLVGGQSVLKAQSDNPIINNYAEGGIIIEALNRANQAVDTVLGAIGSRFQHGISIGSNEAASEGDLLLSSPTTTAYFGNTELIFSNVDGHSSDGGKITKGWAHKDCTAATSTLAYFLNTTGSTVYITDFRIKITDTATATTQFFVGTSTTSYVNEDTYGAIKDATPYTIGGIMAFKTASVLSVNKYPNATGSIISLLDRPHGDERGVYSTNTIPVLNGEYVTVYASSTWSGEDVGGYNTSLLDCEVHAEYMIFD